MRKLLDFIVRKRHWFLFVALEIACLVLIYQNSTYQRSVLISTTNVITGHIASLSGNVSGFFNMRTINRELAEKNGELELKLLQLQSRIEEIQARGVSFDGLATDSARIFPYRFIMAQVKNNSVTQLSNYITINKGEKDGIVPQMGVVSEGGVVGIVSLVSDHFSVVLPVLNPKFRLSCKVLGSNYAGSLVWDGRNARYAQLKELPRHVEFQKGDTVVTSGYSAIFPTGIIIGTVADYRREHDDNFYSLEIELSTNFQALDYVRVLINEEQAEQRMLEKEVKKDGK
ncbi:rod shape-determining protein MreC [Parabacteroides sp. PF5-6]|uniref:rod shape-determining protein MreC n=1 Tax=Parabacteroides sp. PF5-6 TaxID=1742403 RepID=UPI002404AB0F|nr:rod shape-determining protein MreC [Parabacteroides sp. PF5-6]MDF9831500.1 rod shape-determining protein MreC [Parabacteroides sp. PF5-6]